MIGRLRWANGGTDSPQSPCPTPPIVQLQEAECGAAALATVLAYHGAWVPLPEIRERCKVTEFGTTAANLLQAAKAYGMNARAVRLDADQMRAVDGPAIVFWQHAHFLVLEGFVDEFVWLNDPAQGRRAVTALEFSQGYSGIAFPMSPGPGFRTHGEPLSVRTEVRSLADLARRPLIACAVAAGVEGAALAVAARVLGDFAARTIDGDQPSWLPLGWVLLGLVAALAVQGLAMGSAIRSVSTPLAKRLAGDFASVSVSFIALRQPEELSGRMRLPELAGATIVNLVSNGARFVAGVLAWMAVLWLVSPLVAAGFLVALTMATVVRGVVGQAHSRDMLGRNQRQMKRLATTAEAWEHRLAIQANAEVPHTLARIVSGETPGESGSDRRPWWKTPGWLVPILLSLPLIVAAGLVGQNARGAGELLTVTLAVLAAGVLAQVPGGIQRDIGFLPTIVRQFADSREEREFSTDRHERSVAQS